jgi:hypothetical protein
MHEKPFTPALNLQEPWRAKKIEFAKEERRLDIWLDLVTW